MLEQVFNGILPKNDTEYKTSKIGAHIFYAVFSISFIIFIAGWVKPLIAIPVIIITLISLFFAIKHATPLWIPTWDKITATKVIFILSLVAIWVILSGIGGFVFQNYDHGYRNALFEDLVNRPWPVVQAQNDIMLSYYIAFWLPAAAVGKVLGLQSGYVFQMIWTFILIALCFYLICTLFKKVLIWPLLVFIFFSGLDIIFSFHRTGAYTLINHIEWHGSFQFSSMTTQLFWVFNQALPAWAATIFILVQKNCRSLVFVLSLLLLFSPLPFLGLLPICIFAVFYLMPRESGRNLLHRKEIKSNVLFMLKELFTFQNFIGGGVIGIISYFYVSANIAGGNIKFLNVFTHPSRTYMIMGFILEALVFVVLIWVAKVRHPLLYVVAITLFGCCFLKVGNGMDFLMRGSIPALVLLCLLSIAALMNAYKTKQKVVMHLLIILLVFGAATPVSEISRTFRNTYLSVKKGAQIKRASVNYFEDSKVVGRNNFIGSIKNSTFGKYIIKK